MIRLARSTNIWGSCGAIETVTAAVHGTVFFDESGTWVRTLEHASYDSVLTGPTGKSIAFDGRQNAEFTAAGITTLTGQGANVRAPGLGLLYQDVGRLVFDVTVPFPGRALFPLRQGSQLRSVRPRQARSCDLHRGRLVV